MTGIAERWSALQSELRGLAPGRAITVVAVAKLQPDDRVREAIGAGITHFGNNYVQEGEALRTLLGAEAAKAKWHFIGHIQSRKVKNLLGYDCIQSLDRIEIAEELSRRIGLMAQPSGSSLPRCLIEVNIGREPNKAGIAPQNLGAFLERIDGIANVRTDGLMAMPPPLEKVDERARFFDQMKEYFDRFGPARKWTTLSMGTSEDYAVAVRCGATMIRLGTSLLGARPV